MLTHPVSPSPFLHQSLAPSVSLRLYLCFPLSSHVIHSACGCSVMMLGKDYMLAIVIVNYEGRYCASVCLCGCESVLRM